MSSSRDSGKSPASQVSAASRGCKDQGDAADIAVVEHAAAPLAIPPPRADMGVGGGLWTSHSPTGSGPEGSSPNERGSGRSSASHLSFLSPDAPSIRRTPPLL